MSLWRFFGLASLVSLAIAATPAQWRTRSIYFMLTDRFALTDNSTTATCDTNNRVCRFPELSARRKSYRFLGLLWWILAGYYQPGNDCSNWNGDYSELMVFEVGLYPRNGIYCHLDHTYHWTAPSAHGWRRGIPWVLATGYVSRLYTLRCGVTNSSKLFRQLKLRHGRWSQISGFGSPWSRHVPDGRCRDQPHG